MKSKDLVNTLRNTAKVMLNTAASLETKGTETPQCNPRQFKLLIPLGMFAGTAIDALNLSTRPRLVYVGESRMGGIDYTAVRLTIAKPFEIDTTLWTHVGCNTLVWSE
ncbi:hypothetical protein HC000_02060 [Pseudoalteromonas sp. MIP2626]|uniref:hypothetical protein n=1 Tax=Pseudoalteromonas sp. MIP2626 TaxID=2705464 RepID=UPI0015CE8105|nr:hypothetical protein [Pseudoalteromonas sp. MIP2626]NYR11284.1 hypothetical protein [Pseudoalteromonas sp. MIP2626]